MGDRDFEGSLVLEQLACVGLVDAFFDAVDADDVRRAAALLKRAGVGAAAIATVVRMLQEGDGEP
jgi:hypothetical protein